MDRHQKELKVGEFLVENGIVTREQLEDALLMQNDNPDRLVEKTARVKP